MEQLSRPQYKLLRKIYRKSPIQYSSISYNEIETVEYLAQQGLVYIETKTTYGKTYLDINTKRISVRIKPKGEAMIDYIKRLKIELRFTRAVAIITSVAAILETGLLLASTCLK